MLTPMKRPFVILNIAMTADGKTDTVFRKGASISSPEDIDRVDHLRADVDAIMVGGRTLLDDDPRLMVKSEQLRHERTQRGLSANPIKIGVVTVANLRPDSRFLNAGSAQVIILTTSQTKPEQI
jgi:riboflavin-specific deaminase-like protein